MPRFHVRNDPVGDNDVHGHDGGDQVLIETARRITRACPSGSLIARIGGDEFLVAIPGGPAEIDEAASQVNGSFAQPFNVADGQITMSASIGSAIATTPCDTRGLIAAADQHMYSVKRQRQFAAVQPTNRNALTTLA